MRFDLKIRVYYQIKVFTKTERMQLKECNTIIILAFCIFRCKDKYSHTVFIVLLEAGVEECMSIMIGRHEYLLRITNVI